MMEHLLLVGMDAPLQDEIRTCLSHGGYRTDTAQYDSKVLSQMTRHYDLLILNATDREHDAVQQCRSIRNIYDRPILLISDRSDHNTLPRALQAGANDYLVLPLRQEELLLRVKTTIRRFADETAYNAIQTFRSFSIDTFHRTIIQNGTSVPLSSIEYALLIYMTKHPGTLLPYHDLYENVWGYKCGGDIRTVMVHVSHLRKKIDPKRLGLLKTVRGSGYIFFDH